jgi:uncharacterized membrane protein YqjE
VAVVEAEQLRVPLELAALEVEEREVTTTHLLLLAPLTRAVAVVGVDISRPFLAMVVLAVPAL